MSTGCPNPTLPPVYAYRPVPWPPISSCLHLQTGAMATQCPLFTLTNRCHGHPTLPVYTYRPVPWPPNSSCLHLQTGAMATQLILFTLTDRCHGHPTHPVYIYRPVPWPPNSSCLHLQTGAMATQLFLFTFTDQCHGHPTVPVYIYRPVPWPPNSCGFLPAPSHGQCRSWQADKRRCLHRGQCVVKLNGTGSCQGWPVRALILTQARHSLKLFSGPGDQQTHKPSWSTPSIILTILKMSEPPIKVTKKLEVHGDCFQRTPRFVSVLSWLV